MHVTIVCRVFSTWQQLIDVPLSETIRCLEDDLLRELEEKLLERSQIMDPGVMAELVRELELANSKADVSLACTCIHSVNTV